MMRLSVKDLTYSNGVKHYDSNKSKYPFITYFPESALSEEASKMDNTLFTTVKPLCDQEIDLNESRRFERENTVPLKTSEHFQVTNPIIESLTCAKVEPKFATNNNNNNIDAANGFILCLHGGGFVTGNPNLDFIYPLSRYTGCTVYSIDYNLAPETSINQTINDIIKVYDNIITSNANNKYNWNENNAILTGDSAGGSYVLLVLQRLRDRLKKNNKAIGLPCCVWLNSPWTDIGGKYTKDCYKYNSKVDAILTEKALNYCANKAIENEIKQGKCTREELLDKYSAINDDFSGLSQCSMHFVVGATEMFLDDTILCAKKAYDQNVDVSVELHPFLWHSCIYHAQLCQESLAIVIRASQWINQQLNKRKQKPLSVQLKSLL